MVQDDAHNGSARPDDRRGARGLAMSDAASERRHNVELYERLTAAETSLRELPSMRLRLQELTGHVQTFVSTFAEARDARLETAHKIDNAGDERYLNLRVSIDSETASDSLGMWSLSGVVDPAPAPSPTPQPTSVLPPARIGSEKSDD